MSELSESVVSPLSPALTPNEAEAIATLGYIYGYPLVLMDATRASWPAATNQFAHLAELPDDKRTDVVTPNVDTLDSSAWLDLQNEPIVLSVPDVGGRYYVMHLLDAWTNVIAAPGTRTTGNGKGAFAIIGPGWRGDLPSGVEAIQSPTELVWLIGRTYTAGRRDCDTVQAIQRQYELTPLHALGKATRAGTPAASAGVPPPARPDGIPALAQIENLGAGPFFARLARLMKANPPTESDEPLVRRLGRLGIVPGAAFDVAPLPASIVAAVEGGVAAGRARIRGAGREVLGRDVNGWRMRLDLGRYGTNYEQRATVALMGVGANLPEDAVSATTDVDGAGRPLSGAHRYRLRFAPGELPPVKAFWSVTIYNDEHFLVPNPIGRYALGDRDPVRAEADGGLDLLIQPDDPGPEWRANWLPAPAQRFNLVLRLYVPKAAVFDRRWRPPSIDRMSGARDRFAYGDVQDETIVPSE
jgi:hypothetical protein